MSVDPNKELYSIHKQGTFYVAFDIVINFIIIEYNNNLKRCRVFLLSSQTRSHSILKYLKDFSKGFYVRMW